MSRHIFVYQVSTCVSPNSSKPKLSNFYTQNSRKTWKIDIKKIVLISFKCRQFLFSKCVSPSKKVENHGFINFKIFLNIICECILILTRMIKVLLTNKIRLRNNVLQNVSLRRVTQCQMVIFKSICFDHLWSN